MYLDRPPRIVEKYHIREVPRGGGIFCRSTKKSQILQHKFDNNLHLHTIFKIYNLQCFKPIILYANVQQEAQALLMSVQSMLASKFREGGGVGARLK